MSNKSIQFKEVNKVIKKEVVLNNISLDLRMGHTYGLTGINGSGKTMLLRLIAGLIKPTDGQVTVANRPVKLGKVPVTVGALIESPNFINEFTGRENLKLLSFLDDDPYMIQEQINSTLVSVGLNPDDRRLFGKYSLGMKQRLGIAQAIIGKPEIILLDEPTNALDELGINQLVDIVKKMQQAAITLVIASHDKKFLKKVIYSENIIKLENGRVIINED
ncbi:multidrug ABC transporter ATP-binding protein [Lactiplantibacillus plantarum]|uniref:ATP-binding cassette domain-containing protein n=1 Tax=Lactiplantibacillus plantarum TaxID=1590 RepID=UPI0007C73450|nr:ATP-binding cassette domain-containing protein [Lactiplantibacillus plantarum]AYE58632.1 multidrug ABC transporter ATP-binding protein [Lactiplantibacillus plantarum]QBJ56306.1 multidrug ABC transporter ATP-binding protein [Lactiplantibacillus plantarum]